MSEITKARKKRNIWKVPYNELDKNIVELVKVINSFGDIFTVGSCGGHSNPKPYQLPESEWQVLFKLKPPADLTSLEFLVWAVSDLKRCENINMQIEPYSPPPYLNTVGHSLYFALTGKGIEARCIAEKLEKYKDDFYMPF